MSKTWFYVLLGLVAIAIVAGGIAWWFFTEDLTGAGAAAVAGTAAAVTAAKAARNRRREEIDDIETEAQTSDGFVEALRAEMQEKYDRVDQGVDQMELDEQVRLAREMLDADGPAPTFDEVRPAEIDEIDWNAPEGWGSEHRTGRGES